MVVCEVDRPTAHGCQHANRTSNTCVSNAPRVCHNSANVPHLRSSSTWWGGSRGQDAVGVRRVPNALLGVAPTLPDWRLAIRDSACARGAPPRQDRFANS
jgi:hypothetical protein